MQYLDIDPSRLPVPPPPLQQPNNGQPNDAFQSFLQASFLAHPQSAPPPMPLTVRSGVYDLRAVEARICLNRIYNGIINAKPRKREKM